MKKILIAALFLICPYTFITAQELEVASAVDNSQTLYQGSARFMGMGGAFTALGGDISSISLNPAGAGVYTGMQFVFTPSFLQQNTESISRHRGMKYPDDALNYKINLNNLGLMATYNLRSVPGWNTISLGLGYNTLNNFNQQINGKTFNYDRSKMHEFVGNANDGNYWGPYEGLAEDTELLRYDSTFNEYWSFVTDEMNYSDTTSLSEVGVNQQKEIENKGSLGEYFIAVGANYSDKLYLGVSLGIRRYKLTRTQTFTETENANQIPYYHKMRFNEYENHTGTGYNLKIGAIYKPFDFLRLGAAVHTPTFYNNVQYDWYNQMTAEYDTISSLQSTSTETTYAYKLTTPAKLIGGVALKIANTLMLSADYEYLDYSTNMLDDKENYSFDYGPLNDTIQNNLGTAHNLRLGAELKLNQFYLRAGYSYNQSPYANSYEGYQSNIARYSGGVGFRSTGFFMDATFVTSSYTTDDRLLSTLPTLSDVDFNNNRVILTVGLRF
jgi:hypothetical protein